MPQITPTLYYGVDPGEKTGVAVWNMHYKRITRIETIDFWKLYKSAERMADPNFHETEEAWRNYMASIVFVVENPALNKSTFNRGIWEKDIEDGSKRAIQEDISRKVGANCREAELLIKGLRELGYQLEEVRPHGRKGEIRKQDHEKFRKKSGYRQRVSQHGRDAGLVVIEFLERRGLT